MKSAPCKDCNRRGPGCHARCKDYMAWKEEHEAELEDVRRQRQKDGQLITAHQAVRKSRRQ